MTFKTIKPGCFVQYDKKETMTDTVFLLKALKLHLELYGRIPSRIVMNKKNIGFLGNNRGIQFGGHNIPVDTARNCQENNVQFH